MNSYGVLKLSDFGWSIFSKEKRLTFCGTLDYVSPEILSGEQYDCKVDIWSIGVLTYELLTGREIEYSMYFYHFLNGLLLGLFAQENLHLKAMKTTVKHKKRYLK